MVRYKSRAQPAWEMRIAAQLICEMDNAGWHSVQKAGGELMMGFKRSLRSLCFKL